MAPGKETVEEREERLQRKEGRAQEKEREEKVLEGIHLHLQPEERPEVISALLMVAAFATVSREAGAQRERSATTPMCASFVCQRVMPETHAKRLPLRVELAQRQPELHLYRIVLLFADCS